MFVTNVATIRALINYQIVLIVHSYFKRDVQVLRPKGTVGGQGT